jgi:hypothetical protein
MGATERLAPGNEGEARISFARSSADLERHFMGPANYLVENFGGIDIYYEIQNKNVKRKTKCFGS